MASFYYRQDRKLLRLISSPINKRVDGIRDNQKEEFVVPTVDEVVDILKSDYENAYFVTGTFIFHIFLSRFVVFLDHTLI
uniref:Uncharacterized protein n=1 Tax=Cucumis melo TaxID=3656 RepID=A0A9I9EA51_CUCME